MILVADSGSTKCDWVLVNEHGQRKETSTMGFNPFFHTSNIVEGELNRNEVIQAYAREVEAVYFYGAGCSSEDRKQIIADALWAVFPNMEECVVDHDLIGASLATTGGEPGIACIIGTGSNSCFFDGQQVHEAVPALGYQLGDEGSGSYFGRKMLRDWLYRHMPEDLQRNFGERYQLSKEKIFSAVYTKPNANVYLASFMSYAGDNREHPYFKDMIYEGLSEFARIHIQCYEQYREFPVHFVGSIAFYFKDVLDRVASEFGFELGRITQKPVELLADYHETRRFKVS